MPRTYIKHGMAGTPTHMIWVQMRQRCANPRNKSYPDYGGRGIRVCERWRDFQAFLADMGVCPQGYSIDRIDPDSDYTPSNCRWIPMRDQPGTRRSSIRRAAVTPQVIELRRAGHSQEEIADRVGIDQTTVSRVLAANGMRSRIADGRRSWAHAQSTTTGASA